MIELLSPKKIGAIDRPTKSIEGGVGWNYGLDFYWLFEQLKGVDSDALILDVGCGNSPFHTFAEDKLGIDIKGIDRSLVAKTLRL
jgi:hypothetical protein